MMTLFMVFAAVALVVLAGEAVRSQCRRMLGRPVPLIGANDVALEAQSVPAVAA